MNTYKPDNYKIVQIINPELHEPLFKVLASWSGSYIYGSSWKLSSGCTGCSTDGDYLVVPQTSGSIYRLHKGSEFFSSLTESIFCLLQTKLLEINPNNIIEISSKKELLECYGNNN
jgi:hypothetical protein